MNYFEVFIIFCSVTARTEKKYIFRSTGHNLLIQTVRYSPFKEKSFPVGFHVAPITLCDIGKTVVFLRAIVKLL